MPVNVDPIRAAADLPPNVRCSDASNTSRSEPALHPSASLHIQEDPSALRVLSNSLHLASVLSSSRDLRVDFSLRVEATGSHVPHKSLDHAHATFMPDATQPVGRFLLGSSRANDFVPVLTSFLRFRHVIFGARQN